MIKRQSERYGADRPALWERRSPGDWQPISWGELHSRAFHVACALEILGIRELERVAVFSPNDPDIIATDFGAFANRIVPVSIYATSSPEQVEYIVRDSGARILFAGTEGQYRIARQVLEKVDTLDRIVVFDNIRLDDGDSSSMLFSSLLELGAAASPACRAEVEQRTRRATPDDVATLLYTSGTTGFSKGVMLTYDNVAGNVMYGVESKLHYEGSRALSFLPLAHAYGCAFDMLVPLATGSFVTIFGKTPTPVLLMKALSQVRPNLVVCVPLILEKIYRKMIVPMITRRAIRWALAVPFVDSAIYAKIRNRLIDAFGGCFEQVIIGGAPLNSEVEEFLYKIKFPFTVGYGMTECAPLISYTSWREFVPTSCGHVMPNMEVKISGSPNPEEVPGEICTRGQNRMTGYYKNPDATEAAIDTDGWLHTGDMGTVTDGTIFIRGRYKTMILSASGQNIYPEEIEAKLNNMPYVNESLIVERGKGLTAIVYPDYDRMDADKIDINALTPLMETNRVELNKLVAPYEKVDRIQLIPHEFEKTPKKSIKRYLYQ